MEHHHLYLKNGLPGKVGLVWHGYLGEIFPKLNKRSPSLQGKQLAVFITNEKMWAFKQMLGFWNILSATNIFSNEIDGDMVADYFHIV